MIKNKILLYIIVLISIILCVPSIMYLINYKTVDGFDAYYTYTLERANNQTIGLISGIIVIALLLIFSILYFIIIKNEKKIFKSRKQCIIFIIIVSAIFMFILPFFSSDIYYYIGDSWIAAKYGHNPYYTTVEDLQNSGINDEILNNTGYWKNTTSIYGPLWNSIAKFLVSFSFGNVTIALFIFKLASYLIHVLNSYLMYKITKNSKYMLLYGLNPLVLLEFLSNVHNDIYLVLFILLALYFLIRKKNIYFSIIFLALSVSIKYSTVLLVPFILIYCFREKKVPKRILFCLVSGLSVIALVILFYLPYFKDYTVFTNMLVQGSKYSQSIIAYMREKGSIKLFESINQLLIPIFLIIYITVLSVLLFKNKITLSEILKRYNLLMLIFIFIVLTNFQKWYILWLLPTIIFQSRNMRKFIIYLTITALIPSINYFIVEGDWYILGIDYSLKILIISITLLVIDILITKFNKMRNLKEKKCRV